MNAFLSDPLMLLAVWLALGAIAGTLGGRFGFSIAVAEILTGMAASAFGVPFPQTLGVLAGLGAIILAFLAGMQIDVAAVRGSLRRCVSIGLLSFALPYGLVLAYARQILDLPWPEAQLAALALSETSIAMTYVLVVDTGFGGTRTGQQVLAAVFVTNVCMMVGLGALFFSKAQTFGWTTVLLLLGTLALAWVLPRLFVRIERIDGAAGGKAVLAVIALLGGAASILKLAAVGPAYLVGILAGPRLRTLPAAVQPMRNLAFALLTSLYFLRVGSLTDIGAASAATGPIIALMVIKVVSKFVVAWLLLRGISTGERLYAACSLSTGLTFGSFAILFGFAEGLLDHAHYTVLLCAIIGSAVLPALAAQQTRRHFSLSFDPVAR